VRKFAVVYLLASQHLIPVLQLSEQRCPTTLAALLTAGIQPPLWFYL
jgi:hypothetical protein